MLFPGENLSNGRHRRKKSAMAHGRFAVKEEESDQEEAGHIMISYQWANQKTLIEVRDSLIDNGFKVSWLIVSINGKRGGVRSGGSSAYYDQVPMSQS